MQNVRTQIECSSLDLIEQFYDESNTLGKKNQHGVMQKLRRRTHQAAQNRLPGAKKRDLRCYSTVCFIRMGHAWDLLIFRGACGAIQIRKDL